MISEENLFYLVQKNWEKLSSGEKINIIQNIEKDVVKYFNLQKQFEVRYFEIADKVNLKLSKPRELYSIDNNYLYMYNLTDALACYFSIIQLGILEMLREAQIGEKNEVSIQFDVTTEILYKELSKNTALRNKLAEKSETLNNKLYYDLYLMENIVNQICTYDAWFYIFDSIDKSELLSFDTQVDLYNKILEKYYKYIFACLNIEKQLGRSIKDESAELEAIYYDPIAIENFEIKKIPECEGLNKALKESFREMFNTSNLKFGYYDDSNPRGLK